MECGCGGGLDGNCCYTLEYANDIAILICKKFPNTFSQLLWGAFKMVQQWYHRTQMMMIVPFTRKRDLRGLK